jgi:hypothetical protein
LHVSIYGGGGGGGGVNDNDNKFLSLPNPLKAVSLFKTRRLPSN